MIRPLMIPRLLVVVLPAILPIHFPKLVVVIWIVVAFVIHIIVVFVVEVARSTVPPSVTSSQALAVLALALLHAERARAFVSAAGAVAWTSAGASASETSLVQHILTLLLFRTAPD